MEKVIDLNVLRAENITKIYNKRKAVDGVTIEVFEGEKLVGLAIHVRYIVDNEKFIAKLNEV